MKYKRIFKGIVCTLATLMFVMPFSSTVITSHKICFDMEKSVNTNNDVIANKDADWVVMFYQCGDNSISSAIGVCLALSGSNSSWTQKITAIPDVARRLAVIQKHSRKPKVSPMTPPIRGPVAIPAQTPI